MTAQSLAVKAGKVLGTLLAERVLGARPVTLVGYSLGSLVIFEALRHLAALPPAQTLGLVHDVFLFGSPVPADAAAAALWNFCDLGGGGAENACDECRDL